MAPATRTALNGWPFVRFKARIDLVRFLMGIGYERAIEYPWVFRELHIETGHRVMDIGSGTSVFPLFLHSTTGALVHCMDFDRSVLKLKDYADKCGLGESLRNGTLVIEQFSSLPLPYPDGYFDALSCISTIEHSPEESDTQSMLELIRLVRKGGRLVFTVPIASRHSDIYTNADVYNRKFGGDPVFYERHYDRTSIYERLIRPSGATLLSIEAFGEPGFEFGRQIAYRPWIGMGGLLKPFRWTMPLFAHQFITPVPLENPPLRSFCCFVLQK
jgi:ubiquinone/menaquinone biosynthesis C-methylase UbiE